MRPLISILAMAATISTFGATLAEPAQAQQSPAGDARLKVEGQLVTVPAATLSRGGDKLTTSLGRTELRQLGKAKQWRRR